MRGYIVVVEVHSEGKLILSTPFEMEAGKVNADNLREFMKEAQRWATDDLQEELATQALIDGCVATVAGIYPIDSE